MCLLIFSLLDEMQAYNSEFCTSVGEVTDFERQ
jgi:hypothetical protein